MTTTTTSAPLFYIRFLKPPPTECLVGQHFTIVWTIESDLGDQTCWETVPVSISLEGCSQLGLRELNADPKGNSKKKAAALAKPYMLEKVALAREIPLVFDPLRGGGIVTKLVIEHMPVLSVHTMSNRDCGLGMCQFLSECKLDRKYNSLLELGSGTGLVGIYAAELLGPKRVYLTDLPDALEIMQQNVDLMSDTKVEMLVKELSWGPEKQDQYSDVDLVLLTDVLYNQGSHDVLLDTLDWLLDNDNCRALLTYKERNPDEREFFEKVALRKWKCQRVQSYSHLVCEVYWISKVC
ncbi:hypothetical protein MUCCIDRAFT_79426 [Mucor lusitanicus CBS 277.49]|uniref:Uncharacterized protein n=1 Tax=Mucor lusitanicus CBS 277.49 TaxID=747725 RepID=A0A162RDE6_MUCCL|nr:hypothetical protein MUCCIDRAFT_79426 [Mucor lusitanicus CBS 277.49]